MANTTRIVQPFLEGYINQTAVETNMLDGPIFVLTPRPGYVSLYITILSNAYD